MTQLGRPNLLKSAKYSLNVLDGRERKGDQDIRAGTAAIGARLTPKAVLSMCMLGYNVANGATTTFWASDLLHRLLHVPKVGEGVVEHYAGEYDECLELAENHPEEAVRNSDTLQYFALEAYAYDIAVPGEGCAGKWTPTSSEAAPVATQTPTGTTPEAPSATSEAAKVCF